MTRESVDIDALEIPQIVDRNQPPDDRPFLPFQIRANQNVPDFLPIGGPIPVRQTSSTHGSNGYITTDQGEISWMLSRLKSKVESAVTEFSFHELLTADNSKTLIISYGVTARAAKAVYKGLKNTAQPVSLLILKTLWPVPEDVICRVAGSFERILVIEMNLGQYVREIERILPDSQIDFYGQMDGRLITPLKIKEIVING